MIKKCITVMLATVLLVAIAGYWLVTQPLFFSKDGPGTGATAFSGGAGTDGANRAGAGSPRELEGHVRALSEDFHPRCYDTPAMLEQTIRYIEAHFKEAGGRTQRQDFKADGVTYTNVVANFGPETGPMLVVGAHYDSYGENYYENGMYTPGADDNASGVAGLLSLAGLLGRAPLAHGVQLVAYSLEEPPFFGTEKMGSHAHAASLQGSDREVIGMISLEMLGYFDDAEGSQTYPIDALGLVYPTQANFIGVIGRFQDIGLTRTVKAAMRAASDLPAYSMNALPAIPGVDFSDHRNYWSFGHQAVMITDTAFYRNRAYHTPDDTADTLDYVRMSKVVQGVYAAVMELVGR